MRALCHHQTTIKIAQAKINEFFNIPRSKEGCTCSQEDLRLSLKFKHPALLGQGRVFIISCFGFGLFCKERLFIYFLGDGFWWNNRLREAVVSCRFCF
jgi:hypothetical protein